MKLLLSLSFITLIFFTVSGQGNMFVSHSQKKPITIIYDNSDEKTIEIVANALASDFELITGIKAELSTNPEKVSGNAIIIGSINGSNLIKNLNTRKLIETDNLKGKWETFNIKPVRNPFSKVKNALVIYGSDKRGTAYGVFHLSGLIGVSPWHWWADVNPGQKERVSIPEIRFTSEEPSVKYRGIFLNDECWGLNPWASKTFEPSEGNIGPRSYSAIFELLLRLRANLIWPAMHPCTNAFYKNPENPVTANNYGIVVGSSHAEPMLRNNVDEWNHSERGEYNFFTNREKVLNYWEERVKASSTFESVYTLGMRGIHDSGMVGAGSVQEQITALEQIIDEQRKLINKHVNSDITKIPQAFTAYKEVLDIYDSGLKIPDDITIVWPDDNYGYIQRFSDEMQQNRTGGSGVYYHLSYWGRPHDYLWLSTTHPALVWMEMYKAFRFKSTKIWVVNVGDLKPNEYGTSLFLDMAWDTNKFSTPQSVKNHLYKWYTDIFGKIAGEEIAGVMWFYYNLNFERRPEFMGWSQTEPTRKTHYTEYNHFEGGDEAQQRINKFNYLTAKAVTIRHQIPAHLADAFFQLVEYPVVAASLMNKRVLYLEKAYYYARQNRTIANELAVKSEEAFDSIAALTDYYNNILANGKWKGMMFMAPRSLPVFKMPPIPKWQFKNVVDWGIAVEGDEEIRRIEGIYGPLALPTFNNVTKKQYFIDVFLQNEAEVNWIATPSADWIRTSCQGGILKPDDGFRQKRVWISVDWDKTPSGNQNKGFIKFKSGKNEYTISILAVKLKGLHENNKDIFVDENGYISIFAQNANRIIESELNEWNVIDGLGYQGSSIWVNPFTFKGNNNSNIKKSSILEYDFYTEKSGEITIKVFVIPVHPVNLNYSARFGIAVNDAVPQIVDCRTFGRSEGWKQNVLRNNSELVTTHKLNKSGKHVLKIFAVDPAVTIDRIEIDCGGLVKTYSAKKETRAL